MAMLDQLGSLNFDPQGILNQVLGLNQPQQPTSFGIDPRMAPNNPMLSAMQAPQVQPQQPQGILSKIATGANDLGDTFMAIGSKNPSAAFAEIANQKQNAQKMSLELLKASKPTMTPTGQPGIMLATFPDGSTKTVVVDEAVKSYMDQQDRLDKRQQNQIDAQDRRTMMQIDAGDRRSANSLANAMAIAQMKNGPGRALSSTLQKAEDANFEAIDAHKLANDQISPIIQTLKPDASGKAQLQLGPLSNAYNASRGWFGKSTPESQRYSDLERTITQYTNESLRLNKGTQTEGDAQRAVKEVLAGFAKNDNATMTKALEQLYNLNESKIKNNQTAINRRRESQKSDLYDFGPAPSNAGGGDLVINGVPIKKVQ